MDELNVHQTQSENINGVIDDLEVAQKVQNLYSHFVYCNTELHVFDDYKGMYTSDETVIC